MGMGMAYGPRIDKMKGGSYYIFGSSWQNDLSSNLPSQVPLTRSVAELRIGEGIYLIKTAPGVRHLAHARYTQMLLIISHSVFHEEIFKPRLSDVVNILAAA
jgi:hypothetical protein